ncbi:MAG TPA: thiamine biosynthesis protein ThiS [Opitutae bacterium]|nr:thiamine biosynthesis protein ThiS [Opitutae bacterium]|tara:strand:+ start:2182 stop:2385 length:204 start_codon:yes stop_codon:yes gene_type:complete
MRISVNDESREIPEGSTLSNLLTSLALEDLRGWAVAINEQVIPSEETNTRKLFEGDRILLIQATQGG